MNFKFFCHDKIDTVKKFNTFYFLSFVIIIFFLFYLLLGNSVPAIGANSYFGGKVSKVTYCTCYYDFGVVIELDDYSNPSGMKTNVFYSVWRSRLYANYNIWANLGQYVLGGMTPGGSCKNTSGYYCSTNSSVNKIDGTIDMIRGIGSSL